MDFLSDLKGFFWRSPLWVRMGIFAESYPFWDNWKILLMALSWCAPMTPSNMRDYRSRRLRLVTWSTFQSIDLIESLATLSKDQQVIGVVPEKTEIWIGFSENNKNVIIGLTRSFLIVRKKLFKICQLKVAYTIVYFAEICSI